MSKKNNHSSRKETDNMNEGIASTKLVKRKNAVRKNDLMFTSAVSNQCSVKHVEQFSVIVLHYNQQRFLCESLDSVMKQDYCNIELIFADDCSSNLDIKAIQEYVEKNRTPNITNVIYQVNEKNCGTVNNVNQALKAASGAFVMFFAADDKLYDSQVLNNFATALSALPENQFMVSGQCDMLDEDLSEMIGAFVNVPLALDLNRQSAQVQFQKMAFSCLYAMGATAVRSEMYKKYGYFDTTYKIIEDWSYFLHLTRSGSKIIFADFQALLHRDGGVSHFNQIVLPPHVVEYKNDNLLIQEREILPFLSSFPVPEQVRLMERYEADRRGFAALSTGYPRPSRMDLIRQNKKYFLRKAYWWMIDHNAHFKHKSIYWAKKLLPAWGVLRLIQIIGMNYVPADQLYFVDTPFYDTLTWVVLGLFLADVFAYICLLMFNVLFCARRKKKEWFSRKL